MSDVQLISNIKSQIDTEDSLKTLIARHSGIFFTMVKRYLKNEDLCVRDDVVNDKDLLIHNCVLKFDENKGTKFSTYLGNEARWSCINAAAKYRKNEKFVELDENIDFHNMSYEINEAQQKDEENILKNFLKTAETLPDPRIARIFNMRYQSAKKITPWRKISKELGMSIQGCINIHNKALKTILKQTKNETKCKLPA